MTPTPTLLLFVALFWTLPAGAAVFAYRKHGSSMETVNAAFQRIIERVAGQPELQPRPDA